MGKRLVTGVVAVALATGCAVAATAEVAPAGAEQGEGDVALAWQAALAEPESTARSDALQALAPALAERDPLAALARGGALGGWAGEMLVSDAWEAWGRKDGPAAAAGLKAMPELSESKGCIVNGWPVYRVLEGWTQTDPRAAFAWAAADVPFASLGLAHVPLRPIAAANVAEALALVAQLDETHQASALRTVLDVWAESDPQAAIAWLDDAAPQHKADAIDTVLEAWADSDPQAAAAWLDDAALEDAAQVSRVIACAWARKAPRQAFDWVYTFPEDDQRDAVKDVVSCAVRTSPEAASGLLARIPDPQWRADATKDLVASWARSAPQDARRWIARTVEGEARLDLYVWLFSFWAGRDREGAANELHQIASTRHRDWAAHAILRSTTRDFSRYFPPYRTAADIDFAEDLYDRIRDEQAQQQAAKLLYNKLHDIAPERAERYRALGGVLDESNDVATDDAEADL